MGIYALQFGLQSEKSINTLVEAEAHLRMFNQGIYVSDYSSGSGSSQYKSELLQLTSNIVSAYLNKNETDLRQLPQVMETVYSKLSALGESAARNRPTGSFLSDFQPKASLDYAAIEKSITPDYIVCLEDGVRLKTLKRYLFRKYRLTPEQYRYKWGLPPDYPMVAPNYAAKRSALARKMGLGRKAKKKARNRTVRQGK
jgi:predicted transcriptional regulator